MQRRPFLRVLGGAAVLAATPALPGCSSALPAEALALNEAAQIILLWGDGAFVDGSPLGRAGEAVILRPDIAGVIRAGYDKVMPAVARDPSHAYRLAARL